MAIRADKLFRIILKTDRSKQTIERYRRILNVEVVKTNEKEARGYGPNSSSSSSSVKIYGCNGVLRVISRGPFLSMFKHEGKSFVSALESSARALKMNRRRRKSKNTSCSIVRGSGNPAKGKSKSDVSTCNGSGGSNSGSTGTENKSKEDNLSTTKRTIVSAPPVLSTPGAAATKKTDDQTRTLKRKNSDHTGMIIMTDKDYSDEMSAVSVSPVNSSSGESKCGSHTLECINEVPSEGVNAVVNESQPRKIIVAKKANHTPSIECKKKKRSTKKSTRKHKASSSSKTRDDISSVHSSQTNHGNQSSAQVQDDPNHSRDNSASESISNIREVMQANASPWPNKRQKIGHYYTPKTPLESAWLKNDPVSQGQQKRSLYAPSPYALHPLMNTAYYSHAHKMNSITQEKTFLNTNECYEEKAEADSCSNGDSNCFFLGSLLTFFKRLVGPQKDNIINNIHPRGRETGLAFTTHGNEQYIGHHLDLMQQHVQAHFQNYYSNMNYMMPNHMPPPNAPLHASSGHGKFVDVLSMPVYGQMPPSAYANEHFQQPNGHCGQMPPSADANEHFQQPNGHYLPSNGHCPTSDTQHKEINWDKDQENEVSDKLNIYDYQPRIQLPEPGSDYKFEIAVKANKVPEVDKIIEEPSISTRSHSIKSEDDSVSGQTHSTMGTDLDRASILQSEVPRKTKHTTRREQRSRKSKRTSQSKQRRKELPTKKQIGLNEKVPQIKGRSRSLSDARHSGRSVTTCSITRGLSFGSSVSSLSGSLDADGGESNSQIRYYHYR